jgi:protein-S-isoprenylcysteine O-methyltransferase Ste14
VLYPLLVAAWEWRLLHRRRPWLDRRFLPLMAWGYLQYRLCGRYRTQHGGGGPGLQPPPDRLVTSGPYAVSRNPIYLGQVIFLIGLGLTFRSGFGGLLTLGTGLWFHGRVRRDERRLVGLFGEPYRAYTTKVKRWLPGVF